MPKKAKSQDYFTRSALKEIALLRKHLHIKGRGDDVHVSGEISPEGVRQFFREYFASVRPNGLGEDKLVPKKDPTKLTALYVGQADANILLNFVVRHSLYVDQIIVVDPLLNLPHDDVIARPQVWAETIINRALCLCALEQWIEQDMVLIMPNILYYHPEVNDISIDIFEKQGIIQTEKQKGQFEKWFIVRLLISLEPEARLSALDLLESMGRSFSNAGKESLLEEAERYENENPIRFRVSPSYFEKHFKGASRTSQMFDMSLGIPLFLAPLIAEETGSFLVFERALIYEMLVENVKPSNLKSDTFQQLAIAFQSLDFPFLLNVSLDEALNLKRKGYLQSFRSYLREIWSHANELEENRTIDDKILDFSDRLKSEYSELENEWKQIRMDLRVQAALSGVAVGLSAVTAGGISLAAAAIVGLGAGVLKEQVSGYKSIAERLQKAQQKPISVFLLLRD